MPTPSNNLDHCLILDGCSVNSSSSVRNLGVLFDCNLSFEKHVSSICKTAFFHLKNIFKLRPMSNAETLIHDLIVLLSLYCFIGWLLCAFNKQTPAGSKCSS